MIDFRPSKNYPGRTDLIHKTYDDSNMSTIISLSEEDLQAIAEHVQSKAQAKVDAIVSALDEAIENTGDTYGDTWNSARMAALKEIKKAAE